ncbi:hypothetical protein KUCAC02_033576, partial [Chaenocephalus aceratus]
MVPSWNMGIVDDVQLSTEQAVLQETLHKESTENEELMWKLHNGDLSSRRRKVSPTSPSPARCPPPPPQGVPHLPRKVSPTSPARCPSPPPRSFSLQSPRAPSASSGVELFIVPGEKLHARFPHICCNGYRAETTSHLRGSGSAAQKGLKPSKTSSTELVINTDHHTPEDPNGTSE